VITLNYDSKFETMKKLGLLIALIAWFAVIAQYNLMIENRVANILETTIRFFSFFTIITNTIVAIYFTSITFEKKNVSVTSVSKSNTLTAITVYITLVGLIYQIILRHLWQPTGLQRIVDELLHTLIPIMVILFWCLYEDKTAPKYKHIMIWLIYPLIYLSYILIRGNFSDFYTYPFVNVTHLGLQNVLINSAFLIVLFAVLSSVFIRIAKAINANKN
jgi:hypothetical protein